MTSFNETNVTAVKVYFPLEESIQVHQTRVKPCPDGFTPGYHWYGGRRRGPGRPLRWVQVVLSGDDPPPEVNASSGPQCDADAEFLPIDSGTTGDPNAVSDVPYHAVGPDAGRSGPDKTVDDATDNTFDKLDETLSDAPPDEYSEEAVDGDVPDSQEDSRMTTDDLTPGSSRYSLRTARHPPERLA